MKFYIYNLLEGNNTNKILSLLSKNPIITDNFKLHNLVKVPGTDNIYKFNIVVQKENSSVLSKENWYKLSHAFVSKEQNLLIVSDFAKEDLIDTFILEITQILGIKPRIISCNKRHLQFILQQANMFISKVSYLNDDAEFMERSCDLEDLLEEDIHLMEISFFTDSNSLIRYDGKGIFWCKSEDILHSNLNLFKI